MKLVILLAGLGLTATLSAMAAAETNTVVTPEDIMRERGVTLTNCMTKAARELDDDKSSPDTIARGAKSACAREFFALDSAATNVVTSLSSKFSQNEINLMVGSLVGDVDDAIKGIIYKEILEKRVKLKSEKSQEDRTQ